LFYDKLLLVGPYPRLIEAAIAWSGPRAYAPHGDGPLFNAASR
jgi:hypothetical protein